MNALTFNTKVRTDHLLRLPDELPAGVAVRITIEPLSDEEYMDAYQPRTELGRLALAARKAHLNAGGKLLGTDEINEEVRRRRGGVADV